MQLIRITSQPIKYNIQTQSARLEMEVPKLPKGEMSHDPTRIDLHTQNARVNVDATELFESLNVRSVGSWLQVFAQRGRQSVYQKIGEEVQLGNQIGEIDKGVTIAQIVQQKMMQSADITTYTEFIPSGKVRSSYQPYDVSLDYHAGSVETEWQKQQNVMNYIPGKFSIEILQYPKVSVEWLGSPTYVPPSADPNYVES